MAIELNNKGVHRFMNISYEEWREYQFKNKETIRLEEAQWLSISKSGHRVLTKDGISHFIPFGWIRLKWKARDGEPHFII